MTERLGCNMTHALEFAGKLGIPFGWCRCFAQTQSWSPSATGFSHAIAAAARGERPILSFKPSVSVAAAATGGEDAHARAIANGIKAAGIRDGVICCLHEPEDDVAAGTFTIAQWVAMQIRVLPIFKQILGPLGWRTSVCFMAWTVDPDSNRNIAAYLTPQLVEVVDVIGWDPYVMAGGSGGTSSPWATQNPSTTPNGKPQELYGYCLDATAARHKTPMVFETAVLRRQADAAGAERTIEWERIAAYPRMAEFEAICHFEMSRSDQWAEMAIRDEPASLAAFRKLRTVQAPPAETDAQKIARLTAELAAANQVVASLTAERDQLNDDLNDARTNLVDVTAQRDELAVNLETVVADRDRLSDKLTQIHALSA